jgi:hypothetical protein
MTFLLWVIVLLGFDVGLMAQVNPAVPDYYRSNGERVGSYVFRTYTDPSRLAWLLIDGAKDTWSRDPHAWDRSPESYSYRVASGWGRRIVRNTAQLGFESILHEDSRYRPSLEHGLRKRLMFAIRSSVTAYKPDGKIEFAYGLVAAGVVSNAVSSTWHPQSTRAGALLGGIGQSAIDRASGNLLCEFEPDLKRFGRKAWDQILRK